MTRIVGGTRASGTGTSRASTTAVPRASGAGITLAFLCVAAALALAPAARADLGPSTSVVLPEAIWAPATGGGTWVTSVQVTARSSGTVIRAAFFYGSEYRSIIVATATADNQTFRFPNILETMQTLDPSFTYYGRVGALILYTSTGPLLAQAMTTNGNYGKTMPAVDFWSTANSADVGRDMVIPGVISDSTYRFFVGALNMNYGLMTVRFHVMTPAGTSLGYVERTLPTNGFVAFNPFTELGIADACSNHWLHIIPVDNYGQGGEGLFCYGSLANNVTNDTFAMIAIPFQ